jgi:hypothetical protein
MKEHLKTTKTDFNTKLLFLLVLILPGAVVLILYFFGMNINGFESTIRKVSPYSKIKESQSKERNIPQEDLDIIVETEIKKEEELYDIPDDIITEEVRQKLSK